MKTTNLLFPLLIIFFITSTCEKEIDKPENYNSYISLKISKVLQQGTENNSIIQIDIRNYSDKEFLQECILNYSLSSILTDNYYYSQENIVNYRLPNKPNGLLKLGKLSAILQNKDLNDLKWSGEDFNNIVSGEYILRVQLFVKDPYSGGNIIFSNEINISN